jgi:23S rRNA (guanosine2251-2'-O)-methyltransferase
LQRAPEPSRIVAGLQPVREAIRVHGQALARVHVEIGQNPRLEAVERFARDHGVPTVARVSRGELDRASGGVSHQGVVAWAPPLELIRLSEVLSGEAPLLAVGLDGIQDPQNFGAVVRSAVGIARAPLIWGEHGSAPLSTATFRASAGAIEHARLCRVRSLTAALQEAAAEGVAVVGLDAQAPRALSETDLTGPTLLVIGGEQLGLGRSVRRACTALAGLVRTQGVESLNASVAAGIALYEATRQRLTSRG